MAHSLILSCYSHFRKRIGELLWFLALGMETLRENLVLVVKLSTLAEERGKDRYDLSLCFNAVEDSQTALEICEDFQCFGT